LTQLRQPQFHNAIFPSSPEGHTAFYDIERNQLTGFARILSLQGEGIKNGYTDWGWTSLCGDTYKISYDFNIYQKLKGWGYSGGGQATSGRDENIGLGWIEFFEYFNPTTAYLQTLYGDVYSGGDIDMFEEKSSWTSRFDWTPGVNIFSY